MSSRRCEQTPSASTQVWNNTAAPLLSSPQGRFVRTYDAMLHARRCGETFGLAVGEFSAHNRPVLTSSEHHDSGAADMHLQTLGQKARLYHDKASLVSLFLSFDREAARQEDNHAYRDFAPHRVMSIFESVFIKGPPRKQLPDWKRWRHGGGTRDPSEARREKGNHWMPHE